MHWSKYPLTCPLITFPALFSLRSLPHLPLCGKSDCDFKGPLSEMKALPVSISVTVCVRSYWGKTRKAAEHSTVTNRSHTLTERHGTLPSFFSQKPLNDKPALSSTFQISPSLLSCRWPPVCRALHVSRLSSPWYSPLRHNRGTDRGQRVCFPTERVLWLAANQRKSSILRIGEKRADSLLEGKGHLSSITPNNFKGSVTSEWASSTVC